jgi:hypothetical protein
MANTKKTQNSSSTSGFVKFPSPPNDVSPKKKSSPIKKDKTVKIPPKSLPHTKPKQNSPFPTNNFGDFGFPRTSGNGNGDKTEKIKKIFKEVLGKDPEPRDLSYYRFSPMSEDEIKQQLLTGKEHKDLIKKGNEHKDLNEQLITQKAKVKVLNGKIEDQLEEFKQLHNLLKAKNRYIRELREQLENKSPQIKSADTDTSQGNIPPEPPIPHFTNDLGSQNTKKKSVFTGIFRS